MTKPTTMRSIGPWGLLFTATGHAVGSDDEGRPFRVDFTTHVGMRQLYPFPGQKPIVRS